MPPPPPRRRAAATATPLQPPQQKQQGAAARLLLPLVLALVLLLQQPPLAAGFSLPTSRLTSLSPQMPPPPGFGVSSSSGGGASSSSPGSSSSRSSSNAMSPRDFLAGRLPGPYTCLRARNRALLGFDFHLARLLHSIRASGGQVEERALRSMLLDAIEEALDDALAETGAGASPDEGEDGDDADKLVDTSSSFTARAPLDTFVTVHAAVAGGSASGGAHVSLAAHACAMPLGGPPPAPVTLEVRGEGRREPEVKHSKWLWDRQELERYRVGAGGEVALSRPLVQGQGRELLEGLVTNLFVFREGRLLTAGSGVLRGHIREMVLGAARSLGMEASEAEPLRLDEIHTWEEAFLTGSGRILAPIARIEGTSLGLSPVQLPADRAPGPQTTRLRQRLLYDIDEAWEPLALLRGR